MENSNKKNFALLIDADNAEAKFIEKIFEEVGKQGKIIINRVYGDWTTDKLSPWKTQIDKFSIKTIQKFSIGSGKNSTDTAIIIDAMDILHSKKISGICVASGDSDYVGLAQRFREEGIFFM